MTGHESLASWESFYVIVGSSGAALTGLQFIVITLIAELETPGGAHEIATFGTPTILHFGAVLLVAALLSAPWPTLFGAAAAVGTLGFAGTVYAIITWIRTTRSKAYKPVLEDWIWHVWFPLTAYAGMLISATIMPRTETVPLFVIAGGSLLLLFCGIHNAWDTVTFITFMVRDRRKASQDSLAEIEPPSPPSQTSNTST